RSIGNEVVVTETRGPTLTDKPFQVRQGLCNRETTLGGRQLPSEYVERDLVGGAGLGGERGRVIVQPDPVVFDQLTGTIGCIIDRLAVPRIDDTGRELDRAFQ